MDLQVEFQQVRPHRGTLLPLQCRRPQSHLCVQPFARTQAELRRAVLCMVTVYHSKEKKSAKRRDTRAERERAWASGLCQGSRRALTSPSNKVTTGKATQALVLRVLTAVGHVGCPAHMADLNLQRD